MQNCYLRQIFVSSQLNYKFTNVLLLKCFAAHFFSLCVAILFLFQAIFSVTFPNPDVFLVARIDKILQSSISQCADNYIKAADNAKVIFILKIEVYSICTHTYIHAYMHAYIH